MTTWMAREILDQPAALTRTFAALRPQRDALAELAGDAREVLFAARGSSDNAASYGRYLVEVYAGRAAALAAPSLATHYHVTRDLSDTLLVSLSQSGATEEIVATQRWAADAGAVTVAITNDGSSVLAREARLALTLAAGLERAVPATKTYTAQLLAVALLVDALASTRDDVHGERPAKDRSPAAARPSLLPDLDRAPEEVARLLTDPAQQAAIDTVVPLLAGASSVVVSGRGLVQGTAVELALKLEETNLRPVRGLSYADLRHGPIAMVGAGLAVILISAADGPLTNDLANLVHDLTRRGATVIGIGGTAAFQAACHYALGGPNLPELIAPLGLIVPGQQLAERLARYRGLDPDAPRGLSKVTQTDPTSGHSDTGDDDKDECRHPSGDQGPTERFDPMLGCEPEPQTIERTDAPEGTR